MSDQTTKATPEKLLSPINGFIVLFAIIILIAVSIFAFVYHISTPAIVIASIVCILTCIVLVFGLKAINPQESAVYVLFGTYYGTIAKPGFFFINPFCSMINPAAGSAIQTFGSDEGQKVALPLPNSRKVSLRAMTLDNNRQKINDKDGSPIEIGVVVIWKVINPTKAVFEVDNYNTYVSVQCDAAIRNVARKYPYDISEDNEKSLSGSSTEVSEELTRELQGRVNLAGIEIIETRISHLAYAPEIAASMLQRQQADAVIAAKQKIVEGAVGMVEMALKKLEDNETVSLDDERKAAMVSNLLVVLCGGRDAQPVINSGSIY